MRTSFITKSLRIIPAIVFAFCALPLAAADNDDAEKEQIIKERRAIYMAALKEEGFAPDITDAGAIKFKKEGLTYIIDVYPETPAFVHMYASFGFDIDTDAVKMKAYQCMSEVMATKKAVKVFLVNNDETIVFATEFFLKDPGDFKDLFQRYLNTISDGNNLFDHLFAKKDD